MNMALMTAMPWILPVTAVVYLFGSRWRLGLFAAAITQLVYIGVRGAALGRLPLLGPHDTIVFLAVSIAISGLCLSLMPSVNTMRWFRIASGAAAALFTILALNFKPLNMPLPQILDTAWFELHVILAFFAYALFTVGGILCAAFLIGRRRCYLDVNYTAALAGWSFFSASMISGGIWGYYAWGTYWLWTAKELWTSILWLYYALVLHVRFSPGRSDRCVAWLGVGGVLVMLFTYLGVSMLMKSSHSF